MRSVRKISFTAIAAVCILLTACGKVDLTMQTMNDNIGDASSGESQASAAISEGEPTSAASDITDASDISESSEDTISVYGEDFVGCKAAICYDLTEQKIIYEKNSDMLIYPASTTKILTALTAIEYSTEDYIYNVGSEIDMIEQDSSRAWLSYGESFTRDAILTALLAPSGNDAAYTIAANIGRKLYGNDISDREAIDYFCVLMTDYAKSLGALSTNFTVPDGYHEENHYTTCSDMLLFAIEAAKSPTIRSITEQPLAVVYDEQGYVHSWDNGNILLSDAYLPYTVFGMKTGYTDEAGFCFVGAAEMDGKTIITLTFDCDLEYRYADTRKLMDLGFGLYDSDYNYYS